MRFAFCLFHYFPYGGLERAFMLISQQSLQYQHEIDVYTMKWDGKKLDGLNINVIEVKRQTNHQRCYEFSRKLQKYLANYPYDLVVGFNKIAGLDVYYAADLCFEARARQERPWGYRLTQRYRMFAELEQAVFGSKHQTEILLLNEAENDQYERHYGTSPQRFHILPPGVARCQLDVTQRHAIRTTLRQQLNIQSDEFLLLQVASYFKTKGVARAIRSVASLPLIKRNKTKLFIIGRDDHSRYRRLAKRLRIDDRICFLGAQDNVLQYMLAADLMIHPAIRETGGRVLLESLTAGLPILTTANCGYAAHVQKAQAGQVIPMPFEQRVLNDQLAFILAPQNLQNQRHNALAYAESTDLYSLAATAVGLIEKFAQRKKAR